MIITDVTNIGDPMVILVDDTYYSYATYGEFGTMGFFVRSSKDLINWSKPTLCLDLKESWGKDKFWAPEVVCHNGKFIMHYTARSRELNSLRIGVAVSDSPMGPFNDVHGKPMFDLGYATIDASVLITEKGNYMYYSRDCSENIINGVKVSQLYCVRLNEDLTEVIGEHKLVATPENDYELKSMNMDVAIPHIWNEGPCVIEYDGKYVMNYSANCYATNDYSICMAVADDPMGEWVKPKYNPVLCAREGMFGAGHNYIFKDKDGNLMTSFHIQTDPKHPSGDRTMVIGKVVLSKDESGNVHEDIVD